MWLAKEKTARVSFSTYAKRKKAKVVVYACIDWAQSTPPGWVLSEER